MQSLIACHYLLLISTLVFLHVFLLHTVSTYEKIADINFGCQSVFEIYIQPFPQSVISRNCISSKEEIW